MFLPQIQFFKRLEDAITEKLAGSHYAQLVSWRIPEYFKLKYKWQLFTFLHNIQVEISLPPPFRKVQSWFSYELKQLEL